MNSSDNPVYCIRTGMEGRQFFQHAAGMWTVMQFLLTSKLKLCFSADNRSKWVCCYTLVCSSILGFIGIIDQQVAFYHAVAVIHTDVNTGSI